MRSYLLIVVLTVTWIDVEAQNCTELQAEPNMVLSGTFAAVGDPPIQVSCDEGYKLDSEVLEKNITCIGPGVWSENLGSCVLKVCPSITPFLGQNMIVSSGSPINFNGGVNVSCTEGLAYDINYWVNGPSRVTYTTTVYCEDNPNSLEGMWPTLNNCTAVACKSIYSVVNGEVISSGFLVNGTASVSCRSGHHLARGQNAKYYGHYHLSATCNEHAAWVHHLGNDLTNFKCSVIKNYLGCYATADVFITSQTVIADNSYQTCKDYCMALNSRMAAVRGSVCSCASGIVSTATPASNTVCNEPCPAYNTSDPFNEQYCGGPNDLQAVYVLIDGCYEDLDLSGFTPTVVVESYAITCKELCRGLDVTHSILYAGDQCVCTNGTLAVSASDILGDISGCVDTSITVNGTFYKVNDLGLTPVTHTTCEELYTAGVRMNGLYYVTNPIRKEQCYFKDGTACTAGWIGYNMNCYYYYTTAVKSYPEAVTECLNLDADVMSILSQEEWNFLNQSRGLFSDVWADPLNGLWHLGLNDGRGKNTYQWADGNMLAFTKWYTTPYTLTNPCVYEDKNAVFVPWGWKEHTCTATSNFVCKKAAANYPFCADIGAWTPTDSSLVRVDPFMSLTYCIQYCKGQVTTFMLVQNNTCFCTNALPTLVPLSRTSCTLACLGDSYQQCGGTTNTIFSIRNTSMYAPATSCNQLQLFGISGGTFQLTSGLTTCSNTSCPLGWLTINGRCYLPTDDYEGGNSAETICAGMDAYLTSFETIAETSAVLGAMQSIDQYQSSIWRIGLRSLSLNRGQYRWTSGQPIAISCWSNTVTGRIDETVKTYSTSHTNWLPVAESLSYDYICEKGPEQVGCFDGTNTTLIISNYNEMTIQQCAESCRGLSYKYAFIGHISCACADLVDGNQAPGACKTRCSGQRNQMCGNGNTHYTVLDLDGYPQILTTSCTDAFYAGIFKSGYYKVGANVTYCNLIDGGTCPEYWLSINGSCFRHFYPVAGKSREQVCRDLNATQTSLTSLEVFNYFESYLTGIDFDFTPKRVFSGIKRGIYDLDLFISSDGLLTSYGLLTSTKLKVADLSDGTNYISFKFDTNIMSQDGGVICKLDTYTIGCYDTPHGLNFTLENFDSITLGLCRQLCIARDMPIFVVGQDTCACVNSTSIFTSQGSSSACDVPCSIHTDQRCGDGSVVWAHYTGEGDVPYAESCQHLYGNGIFLKENYKIGPEMASASLQLCGISDLTDCPAAWFGNESRCFFFQRSPVAYATAKSICADHDGYLFNPISADVSNYVDSVVVGSTLLTATGWYTGLYPTTYMEAYVASTGKIVTTDMTLVSNAPTGAVGYDRTTQEWIKVGATGPYICQTDPEYLGCHNITTAANETFIISHNSLTQCSQLCMTNGNNYMAVSVDTCLCFVDPPEMTPHYGLCKTVCAGNSNQMCGATDLFNVVNITAWVGMTGTCNDVWRYGMTFPGWYLLRYTVYDQFIKTKCFDTASHLQPITADGTLVATSSQAGYEKPYLLFTSGFSNAWCPATNTTFESITINFPDDYLITGVTIKGITTEALDAYVSQIRIRYRDPMTNVLTQYWEGGVMTFPLDCLRSSDICTHTLLTPVVASSVIIQPMVFETHKCFQADVHGVLYKYFDHESEYVGCIDDNEGGMIYNSVVVNSSMCIGNCRVAMAPYAALMSGGNCYCGKYSHFRSGFIDDQNCMAENGTEYVGQGDYKALYRTFYKKCDEPPVDHVANGSLGSMAYSYVTFVNTFSVYATYNCDPGFFPPSQDVFCQQDNLWSAPLQTCTQFTCPSFAVANGNVTFTSFYYLGVATIECDPGFYTESNREYMSVTCEGEATWTMVPTCTVGNMRSKQANFNLLATKIRDDGNLLYESNTRSGLDCASVCLREYYCAGANFGNATLASGQEGICRLFNVTIDNAALLSDPNWEYFEFQ